MENLILNEEYDIEAEYKDGRYHVDLDWGGEIQSNLADLISALKGLDLRVEAFTLVGPGGGWPNIHLSFSDLNQAREWVRRWSDNEIIS